MAWNRIEEFGPYQDSLTLFDHVVEDMAILQRDPRCYRLIGQQVSSADSVCANMDEGFGRLSRAELIRFFDISRGSARETRGRYGRLKHWLSSDVIKSRLADSIIARLTKSINTLRANRGSQGPPRVRESSVVYDTSTNQHDDLVHEEEIQELLRIE
jgi:four helix bundle protein